MNKDNPIERMIGIALGMFIVTAISAAVVAFLGPVQKAAIGFALALGGIAWASLTACGTFFIADLAMKAANMPSGKKWIIAVFLVSAIVAAVATAVATWRVYATRDIRSAAHIYMWAAVVTFVATTIIAIVAKRSS